MLILSDKSNTDAGHWKRQVTIKKVCQSCNGFFAIRQISGRASAASNYKEINIMKKKFIPTQHAAKLSRAKQMHDVLSATGTIPTHYGLTAGDVTESGTPLTTAQGAAAKLKSRNQESQDQRLQRHGPVAGPVDGQGGGLRQ